ncbi:histidine kinase [Chitinophagaceae bacterium 26-R-25]|nr:histidine kinase [Chitinophagaceae bacterium 26-R-25]
MTKITSELFFFNHFVLITLNFLLFYVTAFHVMSLIGSLQRKWFWVLLGSLLLTIAFTYLKFRLEAYHTEYLLSKSSFFNGSQKKAPPESLGFFAYRFRSYFQLNILTNFSIVVVGFAYRLLLSWLQGEKIRKDLETQNLRTELSYLKMQVNPHFLFNALNNIYSLAVIEESTRTGNSILKLSELIRYMLYEKEDDSNKVSLHKELRHINSYIDLEKLRHSEDVYINFSIEGDISGKRIVPLLLFPLIENAFKHGIITDCKKPVVIELAITDKELKFHIANYNNNYQKDKVGGIGLQNVRKRLDLIYAKNYTFDIQHTNDMHIVNLILPL